MKAIFLLFLFLFGISTIAEVPLKNIKLPSGFKIEVFADHVKGARSLTWGAKGTLFVGTRDAGSVYAITPDKKIHRIASGLNMPNGVAFRGSDLYVAEVNRILKFKDIEEHLVHPPQPEIVSKNFPSDLHHGWKFIAFGPDGKLYVPVGAPCNICNPGDPYASITRMDPDGGNQETFARGIRNSVGFDWHPITKQLWFTDNGRDMLGDNTPPDELNRASHAGMHFGYPFCHGGDIPDPEFGKGKKCSDYTAPEQKLGPHVASLGMRFYTGKMFPAEYQNQIFIAEHGSWNRTHKIGYRISLVKLGANGHPVSYKPFAQGWLQGESAWGRPVDVLVAPDGALLVSDDQAGVIYRISYSR